MSRVVDVAPRSTAVSWLSGLSGKPGAQLTTLLIVLIAVGALLTPNFLSEVNVFAVLQSVIPSLFVGLGASLALYAGMADLSIGSVIGVSAIVFAITQEAHWPEALGMAASVGTGLVVGLLNALATVRFRAEPLIVTLGMLSALRGVIFVIGGDHSKVAVSPPLENLVSYRFGPVPMLFAGLVLLFVIVALYLSRSRIGRHIQAAGSDQDVAVRAGISAGRIRLALLVLSAVLAALAGLSYVGLLDSAPVTLGSGYELQVYAAILISGFSLTSGGIGNPIVTVVGLMIFAVLSNLIGLLNINPSWQDVVTGGILLIAVGANVLRRGDRFD